ncbi:EAL domain-containing protein [Devosia geojensis]|uniref:EAL domain-containing protein n=1 Tax=Devosia geojensis TaxID=443610 RepID=UPI000A8A025C|nr:EAL domain-containing protein [Devosia geojensis]
MKSKYSNVLTLICAVLAFLPIAAVDYLLDGYVRTHEERVLQQTADGIAGQIRAAADGAVESLQHIIADSPSLCTPTFISNVHREIASRLTLKQVLVENADGVQYCDAFGRTVSYSPLSESLPISGQPDRLQVVRMEGMEMPALRLARPYGDSRIVSGFVPLLALPREALVQGMPPMAMARVSLTNGAAILTVGAAEAFDRRSSSADFVSAQTFAGTLPLRVEVATPFAMARARYADLDFSLTVVACLMSAVLLVLALYYVRRTGVPAFDLERAIARGEIKPFYQPVINLRTGELLGCEVLCRWEKRNGKMVPPGAFIEYAEATGLAIPMTLSLMEQVKADLGQLAREMPNLKISINLFDGHFQDGAIVEDVQAIFGGSPIAFTQLVFEITERRPLGNSMQTHAVISGLHALGARLALDDTGTGHSNLAYLATLGVDIIKIDRVFVDMIKPGVAQVPVLDGLIAMSRDLGTEIVAEGVETEDQALYLRARGVYQAQGFLFAPALKASAFKELAQALNAVAPARAQRAASSIRAA